MKNVCLRVAILLLLAAPFAFPAHAQTTGDPDQQRSVHRAVPDGGMPVFDESGFRVLFDRETGTLRRFTQDEVRKYGIPLDQLYNFSGKGLVVHQSPSGVLSVLLNADFLDYSVVRIDADGRLSAHCVRGEAAVRAEAEQHHCATEEEK